MSGVQRNVCAETKERSGRRVPAGAVAIINKKSYQNKCSPPVLKESFLPPLQRASFEAAAAAAAAASSSSNSALSSSAEEHSRPSSEQRMSDQTTLKMPDLAADTLIRRLLSLMTKSAPRNFLTKKRRQNFQIARWILSQHQGMEFNHCSQFALLHFSE